MSLAAILVALLLAAPTHGGLTAHDLAAVGAAPAPGAAAPLGLGFVDDAGARRTLGQAMDGRPTVLVFADYTCRYLCGPGLVLTAAALDRARLTPGRDYSFVVVGLNPRDGPAEARAMRKARLGAGAGAAAQLLSSGPAAALARALGYRYVYDPAIGQYAHGTSVYVLSPAGQVRALLPQFALTPRALTRALSDAGRPRGPAADWPAPLRFICYCLAPLTGAYDNAAMTAVRIAGVGFLGLGGAGLGILMLRRRERRA